MPFEKIMLTIDIRQTSAYFLLLNDKNFNFIVRNLKLIKDKIKRAIFFLRIRNFHLIKLRNLIFSIRQNH